MRISQYQYQKSFHGHQLGSAHERQLVRENVKSISDSRTDSEDEEEIRAHISDFVGYVKIVTSWANDPPEGYVKEIFGGSPDINYGFGGDYAWLRVIKAFRTPINPRPLIHGFQAAVRDVNDLHAINLSADNEPPYRLLYMDRTDKGMCVDSLRLWRSKTPQTAPPEEWGATGMTGNLNEGRGGSYLYLVWHSKRYDGEDDDSGGTDELETWGE